MFRVISANDDGGGAGPGAGAARAFGASDRVVGGGEGGEAAALGDPVAGRGMGVGDGDRVGDGTWRASCWGQVKEVGSWVSLLWTRGGRACRPGPSLANEFPAPSCVTSQLSECTKGVVPRS